MVDLHQNIARAASGSKPACWPRAAHQPVVPRVQRRIIRAGELVAFDTDLIGPFGYCSDISRTWFCGPGEPTDEQKRHLPLRL